VADFPTDYATLNIMPMAIVASNTKVLPNPDQVLDLKIQIQYTPSWWKTGSAMYANAIYRFRGIPSKKEKKIFLINFSILKNNDCNSITNRTVSVTV
jgi:hypothetical protein